MESLLAHITARLTNQRERVATESLGFILRRSPSAREGLRRLLRGLGRDVPPLDRVATEFASGPESRPDIAVFDLQGKLQLLVEGKFWAPLTNAQPGAYLARLKESGGGTLVIVAPEFRLQSLSPDLMQQCQKAGLLPVGDGAQASGVIQISGDCAVVIFSWRIVVDMLVDVATANGDRTLASDADQLRGVCEAFEGEGFRPFTLEDFSNIEIPRLLCSLADLARDIAEAAAQAKIVEKAGYSHGWYNAGRYVNSPQATLWIGVEADLWRRYGSSPLWIVFISNEWGRAQEVRSALRDWMDQNPPRMFDATYGIVIPIELRTGSEKEAVIKHAISQIAEICERLANSGMKPRRATTTEPPPAPEGESAG